MNTEVLRCTLPKTNGSTLKGQKIERTYLTGGVNWPSGFRECVVMVVGLKPTVYDLLTLVFQSYLLRFGV